MTTIGPDDDALQRWLASGAATPPADVARVLDALRSGPATVDQAAMRTAVIEQMAAVLAASPGRTARGRGTFHRFSRRSAAAVFAVTLTAGGVAVAATGGRVLRPIVGTPERPTLDDTGGRVPGRDGRPGRAPAPEGTTTSDAGADTTSAPDDEPTSTAPGGPSTTAPTCESATNHGAYVSGVARSTEPGRSRGTAVRDAARSDCGKPQGRPATTTTSEAPDPDSTTTPTTEAPGNGNGRGNGDGPGNGQDNGPGNGQDNGPGNGSGQGSGSGQGNGG